MPRFNIDFSKMTLPARATRRRPQVLAVSIPLLILALASVPASAIDYIIYVSVDGLKSEAVSDRLPSLPAFQRLISEGASTLNARTDFGDTRTLPNHTTMLTGRPVFQPIAQPNTTHHGFATNADPLPGETLHNQGNPNLAYVASLFDVAHDNGLSTAFYASKSKMVIFDQSYDSAAGAVDVTGADDGRDKIDTWVFQNGGTPPMSSTLNATVLADLASNPHDLTIVHYTDPDGAGHASGWESTVYETAVDSIDSYLGALLDTVDQSPTLSGNTVVIITTDHGGLGTVHGDETIPLNYTIPFFVWGAGVESGGDLYSMNAATRGDPGTGSPDYDATTQPIRNGDGANLALELLGLPPVPGSIINANQDLRVLYPPTDLSLSKTVNDPAPLVGTLVTFSISVSNAGPLTASNVEVVDLLPSGYNYVSDNSGGSYNPATGVWDVGTVLTSFSASLQITASVNPTGNYLNVAEISAVDQPDPDSSPGNDDGDQSEDDEDSAIVVPASSDFADLSLTKSVNDPSPVVGASVVFTITVNNAGPKEASGVVVKDRLPSGYTHLSDTGGGSYNRLSGIWNVGTIQSGGSRDLQITATVNSSGNYLNQAEVTASDQSDPDSTPNNGDPAEDDQDSVLTTPLSLADLSLVKTVNNPDPSVNDLVIFTLSLTNSGPSTATGIEVSDLLPSGLLYLTHSGIGTYSAGTGAWNPGSLAAAGTAHLDITAIVASSGGYTNVAEVVAADQLDPDSTPGNDDGDQSEDDESAASASPFPPADLSLTKTVDNPSPVEGSQLTFTLTLANAGPSAATGIVVRDLLPSGYTYVSDTGAGSYDSVSGDWSLAGTLVSGADAVLQITASVLLSGDHVNVAELTAANVLDPDSTPDNDDGDQSEDDEASVATTPVSAGADLSLSKTVDDPTPLAGDEVVFTLTLTNDGPSHATNIQVRDLLPSGYTYLSDDSGGDYERLTGLWDVGLVLASSNATLEITATTNASGNYTNVAEVTAVDQADPDSAPNNDDGDQSEDDEAASTVTPVAVADLSLTKTVDDPTPVIGQPVVFNVTVTNSGPSSATGVLVQDLLPTGYTYVTDDAQGAYDSGTGQWVVGTLGAASSSILQITATVDASGDYENVAEVTAADQVDLDSTPDNDDGDQSEDDESSVSTSPQTPYADLSLTKTANNTQPGLNQTVAFTLQVSNAGPSAATGVVVKDLLPPGFIYESSFGVGSYSPVTGIWNVGNVGNGSNQVRVIMARVTLAGPFYNDAQIVAVNELDPDSSPNNDDGDQSEDDEARVQVTPPFSADLSLDMTVDDPQATFGQFVRFTLTVANAGPATATSTKILEELPTGFLYQSHTGPGSYDTLTGVWSPGTLFPGAIEDLEILALVHTSGNYVNVAEIQSTDQGDPDSAPNNDNGDQSEDDEASAAVTPWVADLSLTKDVDKVVAQVGELVVFTVGLNNAGPDVARDIIVHDLLPDGYSYVSDSSSGQYDPITGNWTVLALPVGFTFNLDIVASINADGDHLNVAQVMSVSAQDPDSTPGNGSAGEDDYATAMATPTVTSAPPSALRNVLWQNQPNPFNPRTTLAFQLAQPSHALLRIYDVGGRLVRKMMDRTVAAGEHRVVWNGLDDALRPVGSGVYYYRLDARPLGAGPPIVATRKMTLVR